MKHIIVASILSVIVFHSCKTTSALTRPSMTKMTVVSFNSICCGTRPDDFLKSYFETFKSQYKIKLHAWKITGCGKEGEYKVMFATGDLSPERFKQFSDGLASAVEAALNKNKGDQLGPIIIETVDSVDVSFCRGTEVSY